MRPPAKGTLAVDVFGNDGVTVIDTGKLTSIDNQVDPDHRHAQAEGRIPQRQLPALARPVRQCAAESRDLAAGDGGADLGGAARPAGTFSLVIGEDNVVTAKPVTVTQQNEHDAVIASGLSPTARLVTTGFANL